jgi:hypothetical protein
MSLMRTNDAGEDHVINDVLLHCFALGEILMTLCGQNYENVMYAHRPGMFKANIATAEPYEMCPACVAHPDLPLALLGDL